MLISHGYKEEGDRVIDDDDGDIEEDDFDRDGDDGDLMMAMIMTMWKMMMMIMMITTTIVRILLLLLPMIMMTSKLILVGIPKILQNEYRNIISISIILKKIKVSRFYFFLPEMFQSAEVVLDECDVVGVCLHPRLDHL